MILSESHTYILFMYTWSSFLWSSFPAKQLTVLVPWFQNDQQPLVRPFCEAFFFLCEKQRRQRKKAAAAKGMGPWRMKMLVEGRKHVFFYFFLRLEMIENIEATGILTQQIAVWKWVKQMETQVFGSMLCLFIMVTWIVTRMQNRQNHENHHKISPAGICWRFF